MFYLFIYFFIDIWFCILPSVCKLLYLSVHCLAPVWAMAAVLVPWYRKCARESVMGDSLTSFRLPGPKSVVKGHSHTHYTCCCLLLLISDNRGFEYSSRLNYYLCYCHNFKQMVRIELLLLSYCLKYRLRILLLYVPLNILIWHQRLWKNRAW